MGLENKEIILGGGCFWCVEAVLELVNGVENVVPGYMGGTVPGTPTYREICSGLTGHAEVIKVDYDPAIISLSVLLEIFLTTHDPTTLNRQGADVGTQYRSVIFYASEEERVCAETTIQSLKEYFGQPIVTSLEPKAVFYEAEKEHHNYYSNNPFQGYCQVVISPKVSKLKAQHSKWLK